jgi:cytoskeletal protein RodZ
VTELGRLLKETRKEKGLSLEEIHQLTKIQKRYLEAIEEGNLDALPGHFYARAFAKSYAEAVGLDPDIVMEKIRSEATPQPIEEEQNPPLRRGKPKVKAQIPTARWLSKALLYLFAVLILFVIYIAVSQYDKNPGKNVTKAPTTPIHTPEVAGNVGKQPGQAQPKVKPTPAPTPKAPVTPTVSFLNQQGNVYHYQIAGANQIDITITGKEVCWARVVKGGQNGIKVDEVTVQPNETKHWLITDAKEAWIRMGNAPGVVVKINGQVVDTSKMARALQIIAVGLKQ